MLIIQSRRRFLAGLSAAGAASLVGVHQSRAAEPPPETTTVRLAKIKGICISPQYRCQLTKLFGGLADEPTRQMSRYL
jgi:NitT/TauT family transport system substrate-binding protein